MGSWNKLALITTDGLTDYGNGTMKMVIYSGKKSIFKVKEMVHSLNIQYQEKLLLRVSTLMVKQMVNGNTNRETMRRRENIL